MSPCASDTCYLYRSCLKMSHFAGLNCKSTYRIVTPSSGGKNVLHIFWRQHTFIKVLLMTSNDYKNRKLPSYKVFLSSFVLTSQI